MWDPGSPGALPKCFNSSLTLGPLRSSVLDPIMIFEYLFTCWVLLGKLIEGHDFTTSGNDSLAGSFSESESTNSHLWENNHTDAK